MGLLKVRRARGTALVTVILVSALLMVVCFSIATLSVLNLNLSTAHHNVTQARFLAMAVATQICVELADQRRQTWTSPLSGERPVSQLVERFHSPVFPKGAENLPGEALVSFDETRDHYSVDNLDSPYPAAGWTDRGSDRKSVPPFSLSLVVGARVGGQTTWFEAVLSRRWPFVLCTPGRVNLMGTLDRTSHGDAGDPRDEGSTRVRGPIYSLFDDPLSTMSDLVRPSRDFTVPLPSDVDLSSLDEGMLTETVPRALQYEDVIEVSDEVMERVRYMPSETGAVNVGGRIVAMSLGGEDGQAQASLGESRDNRLDGTVFSTANTPENVLRVADGNVQRGGVRTGQDLRGVNQALQRCFVVQEPGDCVVLKPQSSAAPPTKVAPNATGTNVTPSVAAEAGSGGIAPPPSRTNTFYKLERTLRLGADGEDIPGFGQARGSRFRIPCSAGNRWREGGVYRESGCGIEITNAMLYVDGNLDLSAKAGADGQVPFLRGSNSTIVVRGTLSLCDASVDALDQGMVIYASRLVSEASGSIKGLLLVEKGALFLPPRRREDASKRLRIQGGLICGNQPLLVRKISSRPSGNGGAASQTPTVPSTAPPSGVGNTPEDGLLVRGVCLWSTDLIYDATYLKALHSMGPVTLSVLRQVE